MGTTQKSAQRQEYLGILYTLIRSKRSRYMTITVRDGNVIVRAPATLPHASIEDFIGRKAAWIAAKQDAWRQRSQQLSAFETLDAFLLHGAAFVAEYTTIKKMTPCDGVMQIPLRLKNEPHKLFRAAMRFYKDYAFIYLHQRLRVMADEMGLSFRAFALSNARRKWGSCKSTGDIRLNWRLVFLEQKLRKQ